MIIARSVEMYVICLGNRMLGERILDVVFNSDTLLEQFVGRKRRVCSVFDFNDDRWLVHFYGVPLAGCDLHSAVRPVGVKRHPSGLVARAVVIHLVNTPLQQHNRLRTVKMSVHRHLRARAQRVEHPLRRVRFRVA